MNANIKNDSSPAVSRALPFKSQKTINIAMPKTATTLIGVIVIGASMESIEHGAANAIHHKNR
jgi:hypothetical protein